MTAAQKEASSPNFAHPGFRMLVAICIASVGATYSFVFLTAQGDSSAADFTWHWLAARALLEGLNPYEVVTRGGEFNLVVPYLYPLPGALVSAPFAVLLDPIPAASLYVWVSTFLLAWGLTADGYHRLPVFLSVPYLWAANSGQFSPILAAAAVIPALGWLWPIKPTLGLAILLYRPTKFAVIGSAILLAAAFALVPTWVTDWRGAIGQRVPDVYWAPVTVYGGPLLLLSIVRWRRREARLLFTLSLMPQLFFFYDQLLLWLVPKTWRESAGLTVLSWVALFIGNSRIVARYATDHDVAVAYAPVLILLLYWPALILALLPRKKSGEVQPS